MRVSRFSEQLRRASIMDDLDNFFVTIPANAWGGKKEFLAWLQTPKGQQLLAKNLGWPSPSLVSYINGLKGTDWSNLVRTYR